MFKVRSAFRHRQHDITAIQCLWRRKLAKRELRKLKQVWSIFLSTRELNIFIVLALNNKPSLLLLLLLLLSINTFFDHQLWTVVAAQIYYGYKAFIIFLVIICFNIWQEANETGALRLAKSKLEKQLEDLTWRLQLEKKLRVLVSSSVFRLFISSLKAYLLFPRNWA